MDTADTVWLYPAALTLLLLLCVSAFDPVWANWIAIGLFLLGVPHGAVERSDTAAKFIMPTMAYTSLYIVFGILVFASWLISPLGTLVIFLLLSAWHFGQSEPHIRSIGLWVIIGSCLFYPAQTLGIFAQLSDSGPPPQTLITLSTYAALAVIPFACMEHIWHMRKGRQPSLLRPAFVLVLFLVLPPIPAVAVYFFALHGLGEFARTLAAVSRGTDGMTVKKALTLYAPATLPAMIGAVVILTLTVQGYVPIVIATGLAAAFIIPHMVPVEKLLSVDRRTGQ